ncbi:MAG: rod shape-determining protein MreC [Acidimicrobiales bacterium]
MAFPRRSSRSPRSRATLALLVLTAVTILVLDLPGTGPLDPVRSVLATAFRPFRAAGNAIFEPLSNGWKGAFDYDDVKDENADLKRQLEDAKGVELENERLIQENAQLREALGIEVEGERTRAAEIVSGPISSFEQIVVVNAGSSNGVKKYQAVVTGGGVLGKVADVKGSSATVDLLTKPGVKIGIATKLGTLGTVEGQGPDRPLVLTLESLDDKLREGDPIYTSGIDRTAIPGDLPVGRVSKVIEGADGVAPRYEVEPSADLTSRYVKVVLKDPPP